MGFEPPKPVAAPLRDETHDAFGEEFDEQPLRNPIAALTPVHRRSTTSRRRSPTGFASRTRIAEEGEDSTKPPSFTSRAEAETADAVERVEPAPVAILFRSPTVRLRAGSAVRRARARLREARARRRSRCGSIRLATSSSAWPAPSAAARPSIW